MAGAGAKPDHLPEHPAHALLAKAYPPDTAQTLFVEKILQKPLSLRPTSPDPTSKDARSARRLKRLRKKQQGLQRRRHGKASGSGSTRASKPRPLSAKEKRAMGLYEIPREKQKYALFTGLNRLWIGYVREILDLDVATGGSGEDGDGKVVRKDVLSLNVQTVGAILAAADFHGAELEVVRSRCVSRVGCRGIVVKDTKFTFEVVTKDDVIKVVPKEHTIFRFEVPLEVDDNGIPKQDSRTLKFELHGSQFKMRAVDRATRKFKQRRMDDL